MLPTRIEKEIALEAFKSQRENMFRLFCSCLPELANSFYAKSLIPNPVLKKLCNESLDKTNVCVELMNSLEDKIASDPFFFTEIVHVLQSADVYLKKIPEDLVTTYKGEWMQEYVVSYSQARLHFFSCHSCPMSVYNQGLIKREGMQLHSTEK